jgi:hypothetical protein
MASDFSMLLKESAAFVFQRQHWIRSSGLIAISFALPLLAFELDQWFGLDEILAVGASWIVSYLFFVVFPLAWYRAVLITGVVHIDYGFSQRTWNFIGKNLQIFLLLLLFAAVAFVTWSVIFGHPEFPKFFSLSDYFVGFLLYLPFSYLMLRLEFVLPAAAIDRPMVLGEAWDVSASIQWPFFSALAVVWVAGGVAGFVLDEAFAELDLPLLDYIGDAISLLLSFVILAINVALAAYAYKKVVPDP